MTSYQLLYLRFLQMKQQFPELNHTGHAPILHPDIDRTASPLLEHFEAVQRMQAEEEFFRPSES